MNLLGQKYAYEADTDTRGTPGYRIRTEGVSLVAWVPFGSIEERKDGEDIARLLAAAPQLGEALAVAWHALLAADKVCHVHDGAVSVQVAAAKKIAREALMLLKGPRV